MDKIYVRRCERYTLWEASKPIEVDIEKLRKCAPPYKGDSTEELMEYLRDYVLYNYEWAEINNNIYGETESYELTMAESDNEIYSDSRNSIADDWIEVGIPNDEYRKTGNFESISSSI